MIRWLYMKSYDHKKIEKKWQEQWAKDKRYETPDTVAGKKNFYLLVEFPYPSGNLHAGHWYAFAVPDILARHVRMKGKNVLYPIGFDAFGLPAENAAIKNKVNPRVWTQENIASMKKQIASMGASFDTSRLISTIDPAYYKWTQWQFLQFFKKGLAYQKETAVNWCPKDKTVLANEQVIQGRCERCDSLVEQRQMLQWNLKISDYADRLVDDLAPLDWPEEIKEAQRNWIGRSEGAEIDFFLDFGDEAMNSRAGPNGKKAHITVFTTRPDTLFGATYLVLAPEHLWVQLALQRQTVLKNNDEVQKYVDKASKKTELERQENREKTGVKLEGVEALNPATGEKIPLFVADYVLASYGTGAIMAVPAHDERDFEFAKKFQLPVVQVVAPVVRCTKGGEAVREGEPWQERDAVMCVVKHWEKDEYLCIKWQEYDVRTFVSGGIEQGETPTGAAARELREETGYVNARLVRQLGAFSFVEFYHQTRKKNIRARVRYYLYQLENGEQIAPELEEHEKHSIVWKRRDGLRDFLTINERDKLLRLIDGMEAGAYTGDGRLVNSSAFDDLTVADAKKKITAEFGRVQKTYKIRDWIVSRQRYWGVPIPIIHCGKCGPVAVPDKELPVLLPEVKDYLPTGDGKSPLAKVKKFVETKCPRCGEEGKRETDTFDTFVDSSWYFLRYTDPHNEKEFASRAKQDLWMPVDLYSGGPEHTTMHVLYSRFWHKALYDLGLVGESEPYARRMNHGLVLGPDGQKMSKSRGNVIDLDEMVARLGADTVRMYLAFIGPYNEAGSYPWNPNGPVGARRFLERLWRAGELVGKEVPALEPVLHRTIKKVGDDIEALKFNTAIAQLMMLLKTVEKEKSIGAEQWKIVLRLLAPFAPHVAEELWHEADGEGSVHAQAWPSHDGSLLVSEDVTIVVQIDGKTRGQVRLSRDAGRGSVEEAARAAIGKRLEGKAVARIVVVPNRLVNFVTS